MLTVDFEKLAVKDGQVVLDAGCGFGRHSLEFLKRGAFVFSMDTDMESLLKARYVLGELKRDLGDSVKSYVVHSGDALNLPFKDNTFDRIICAEVMEHVGDDDKACSELSRVLKRNGRIAITVPTFFSEMIYDTLTFEYFATPGGHVRKYFPKNLIRIIENNGLLVYAVGFKHAFHTLWWIIRCVVGLHDSEHPLTRWYHQFLHLGLYSTFMRAIERFCNYFFPKSIVVYAWKP